MWGLMSLLRSTSDSATIDKFVFGSKMIYADCNADIRDELNLNSRRSSKVSCAGEVGGKGEFCSPSFKTVFLPNR